MLFSEEYQKQLSILHNTSKWGGTAAKFFKQYIKPVLPPPPCSILDYGSGQGAFRQSLRGSSLVSSDGYKITEYEPAHPHLANNNVPCDFVVCIDVLEHIEPNCIDAVLDDLKRCTLSEGYFTISCRKASKILPDGRNAHLIVEPPEWWKEKLEARFKLISEEICDNKGVSYHVHVGAK